MAMDLVVLNDDQTYTEVKGSYIVLNVDEHSGMGDRKIMIEDMLRVYLQTQPIVETA